MTYSYALGTPPNANPLITSVADATAGTVPITTTTDLLGRVVAYTDAWNQTTNSTYDQTGRLTTTNGPRGRTDSDYDAAGRLELQYLADPPGLFKGGTVADPSYHATTKELTGVSYPALGNPGNGTSLTTIGRDLAGRTTGLTWTGPASPPPLLDDQVRRSQSGRVTDQTIDTVDSNPGLDNNFIYDAAGRLTQAWTPGHALSYTYAPTLGCGFLTGAGKDTNRTAMVDNAVTTTYCYGADDRLSSASDAAVGTPVYDTHGNTTTLGSQTLIYDGGDRHVETRVAGGATVRYVRDATDRIVSRTEGVSTTRYGHAGSGDGAGFTMTPLNQLQDRFFSLPGGALLTKRASGDIWSYPNIHGDVVATANAAGLKQGTTLSYDPFGQGGPPENAEGNFDYGWLGQHQRGTEHAAGIATVEMGARQYVPKLGRFLSVDPVRGGSCNDFDYTCGDPINASDLTGQCAPCASAVRKAATIVAASFQRATAPAAKIAEKVAFCSDQDYFDSYHCQSFFDGRSKGDLTAFGIGFVPKKTKLLSCPSWLDPPLRLVGYGDVGRAGAQVAAGHYSDALNTLGGTIVASDLEAQVGKVLVNSGKAGGKLVPYVSGAATIVDAACSHI